MKIIRKIAVLFVLILLMISFLFVAPAHANAHSMLTVYLDFQEQTVVAKATFRRSHTNISRSRLTGVRGSETTDWWPMFHHDLMHTGYSTSSAPDTNEILWTHVLGGWVQSSPAVYNNIVYVGSDDNKIYALNATTGEEVWNYMTNGDIATSSPAVAQDRVYIGSTDNNFYCLDAETGDFEWKYTTGGDIQSSPSVAEGRVLFGSDDGKLYALNATTGGYLWSYSTGDNVWSSPAVSGGKVFVGSMDRKVYALDLTSGSLLWNYTTTSAILTSPAVLDGRVFIASSNRVCCLAETNGNLIWNYTTGGPIYSSPAIFGGNIYIGCNDYKIYCLNATNGNLQWTFAATKPINSSPAIADGKVFFGSEDRRVYSLDANTGQCIWEYSTGGRIIYSSPAVALKSVFIGSSYSNSSGKVYAFYTTNHPPEASNLTITPSQPTPTDNLIGNYDYYDLDGDPENGTEIMWYKNSIPQPLLRNVLTVPSILTAKGERWYFTVTPKDGKQFGTTQQSPTVTINTPPTIDTFTPVDTTPEVNEGDSLEFTQTSSDPDGDPLSYSWLLNSVERANTQNWTYFPNYDDAGIHNVTLVVSDSDRYDSQEWAVTVHDVNFPPTIDSYYPPANPIINEEESQEFNVTYSDPEGDPTTVQWYLNGTPTVTTDSYIFNADYDSASTYNITVIISDGSGQTSHEWTLTVLNVNRAPTIGFFTPLNMTPEVNEGGSLEFMQTSSDPDDDPLSYSWLLDSVKKATTQNWTYTPDYQAAGVHNVTLVVSDGDLHDSQEWVVTVHDVNRPPSIDSYYPLTDPIINEGQSQEFNVTYSDPEGDPTTVQWYLNGTPTVTTDSYIFNADYDSAGTYNISVIISDGFAQTSHEWLLTVLPGIHDVAVVNILIYKTVVCQGCSMKINTTVQNQGDFTETFNVTVHANTTLIERKEVTLTNGTSTTITFILSTADMTKGNYTIWAQATVVPGEMDTANNNYIDNWVLVSTIGDITGPDGYPDGKVDMRDIGLIAKYFGKTVPPAPPNCDLVGPPPGLPDGIIDMRDIGLIAKHFGETDP